MKNLETMREEEDWEGKEGELDINGERKLTGGTVKNTIIIVYYAT